MEKMLHFGPKNDVILLPQNTKTLHFFWLKLGDLIKKKKKVFTKILMVFPVGIRKKVFRLHMLFSQCHFDGPLSSSGALCWARWSQQPSWSLYRPLHEPRGHCPPLPPSFGAPGGVPGGVAQKLSGEKIAFAAQQLYTKINFRCFVV